MKRPNIPAMIEPVSDRHGAADDDQRDRRKDGAEQIQSESRRREEAREQPANHRVEGIPRRNRNANFHATS